MVKNPIFIGFFPEQQLLEVFGAGSGKSSSTRLIKRIDSLSHMDKDKKIMIFDHGSTVRQYKGEPQDRQHPLPIIDIRFGNYVDWKNKVSGIYFSYNGEAKQFLDSEQLRNKYTFSNFSTLPFSIRKPDLPFFSAAENSLAYAYKLGFKDVSVEFSDPIDVYRKFPRLTEKGMIGIQHNEDTEIGKKSLRECIMCGKLASKILESFNM